MKIKSITWCPKSHLLEITYEDGVKGTMHVPEEWGEFRGVTLDPSNLFHDILWEYCRPHAYAIYTEIKTNSDSVTALKEGAVQHRLR